MQKPPLNDLIEERAAIIEEGEGCARTDAQDRAAKMHGFKGWQDYLNLTRPSKG